MRGLYQILMPLLGLFFVRVDLTDLFPLKIPVKVVKIYDGDTIQVRHKSFTFKVRLAAIDAPEKEQGQAGEISRQCLEKVLIKNQHHLIIFKQDIYGRILGDLEGLTLKLIENGCASLYPHAQFHDQVEKFRYLTALKTAKAAQRGLWKYGGFVQPKKWRRINKQVLRRRWHRQDHSQKLYRPERKRAEKEG